MKVGTEINIKSVKCLCVMTQTLKFVDARSDCLGGPTPSFHGAIPFNAFVQQHHTLRYNLIIRNPKGGEPI